MEPWAAASTARKRSSGKSRLSTPSGRLTRPSGGGMMGDGEGRVMESPEGHGPVLGARSPEKSQLKILRLLAA